jgi:hypothetical protein
MDECGFWKNYTGELRRPADSLLRRGYWTLRLLLRAVSLCLRFLPDLARADDTPRERCDALLVYVTENQRRAFHPWNTCSPGIHTASWMREANWRMSRFRCGILTLRHSWQVYRLLRNRADHAQTMPWIQEFVRYRVGLELARELYERARPRVVVISNDHSGECRAFMRAAREFGSRLVYTQHASIGKNFPPLNFDLALLDGIRPYLQYRESGVPRCAIVFTGRVHTMNKGLDTGDAAAPRVGLATNLDDSLIDWIPVLRLVGEHFPGSVLRCHPAEIRRPAWRFLCRRYGLRVASGSLDDFLRGTTVLISGTSGIILDAALHGIPCLIRLSAALASGNMRDYYGYEKAGLCRAISDLRQLPDLIRERSREKISFEQLAAYEAGLVQDPAAEKRAALALLIDSLKNGGDVQLKLRQRYVCFVDRGTPLFMRADYARLNDEHRWLSQSSAQSASPMATGGYGRG